MSGRKQFDEEAALEAAMRLFWTKGYEAASMAEIEAATGLSKSSIYNAWGGKAALYALCLKRYARRYGVDLFALIEGPGFAAALARFFEALIARFENPEVPDGCMAAMAEMEFGGDEGEAAGLAKSGMTALQRAFAARCRRAAAEGEIPAETDCDAVAAMLLAQTRGIAVLNRGAGDARLARAAVRGLIGALSPARAAPQAAPQAAPPAAAPQSAGPAPTLSYPDP